MHTKNSINTYIFPVVFIVLCMLGNYISKLFLYAAFISVIVEIILNPLEDAFCFSFFLIPSIRILDGTGISFLVNLLIALPLVKYIVRNGLRFSAKVLKFAVLFLIIIAAHDICLRDFSRLASECCWLMSYMMCAIVIENSLFVDKRKIGEYFALGIIGSAVAYLVTHQAYTKVLFDYIMDGGRFEAYADDPNYYSLYICLTVAILLSSRKKNVAYLLYTVALVVVGFLTASKMCMILMILIVLFTVVFYIVQSNTRRSDLKFIRKLLALIVIALIYCRNLIVKFINNLFSRAGLSNGSLNLNSLTTGRSTIFLNYITILHNNILALVFGAGFSYNNYLGEATGHAAHNTYLEFVLCWGLIGAFILVGSFYELFGGYFSKFKSNRGLTEWIPMIILGLNFLDLGCMSATMFWWVLTAAVISTRRDDYEEML